MRDRSQAGPREAQLIPPREVEAALLLVARKEYRLAREDLVKRTGQLLGFSRAGGRLRQVCQDAVERLLAAGHLREEHGVVTLAD